MMTMEWWYWAVLGIGLMVAELLLPAFVLIWFGLGALFVSLVMFLAPETSFFLQILIWIVMSSGLVVLWFRVFKPSHHATLSGRSSAQAVGEVGLLIKDVAPFQKSQVRFQVPLFGSDIWECVSDEAISAGERVKVVSVDGSILKIAKSGAHT